MKTITVMLAGGRGERMGGSMNKVLIPLSGKTVLRRSVEAFRGLTDEMIVVARQSDMDAIRREAESADRDFPLIFASGGFSRQQSVLNGLRVASAGPEDCLLIHDAARCLVSPAVIRRVLDAVKGCGTGVPSVPVTSTCKLRDENGYVLHTLDRNAMAEIQTPQGFRADLLKKAFRRAEKDGFEATDDAGLLEHAGTPVLLVEGDRRNIKLTSPEDLPLALMYLKEEEPVMRIGMGYDVHRWEAGRKLFLCGVEIPWERGLLGHSDADAPLHALMDAMLGGCALGDIGRHFPDTDPELEGVSSLLLLRKTNELIHQQGYSVCNADITIVAQRPKIAPYIPAMNRCVAETLGLPADRVNVKATTTEKLGFEGREEGLSAYAVCTLEKTRIQI